MRISGVRKSYRPMFVAMLLALTAAFSSIVLAEDIYLNCSGHQELYSNGDLGAVEVVGFTVQVDQFNESDVVFSFAGDVTTKIPNWTGRDSDASWRVISDESNDTKWQLHVKFFNRNGGDSLDHTLLIDRLTGRLRLQTWLPNSNKSGVVVSANCERITGRRF